jgi:archaellum component FlaC
MDFNDLAGKAKDLAEEHPEQLEGAVEKLGETVKEKYGHDEQVDEGIAKIKGAIPGGE